MKNVITNIIVFLNQFWWNDWLISVIPVMVTHSSVNWCPVRKKLLCMFKFQNFLHLQFLICNRWVVTVRYPSGKHSLYSCFLLRCLQGVDKLVTRPGDNVTIAGDDSAGAAYSSQLEVSQVSRRKTPCLWLHQGLNLTTATSVSSDYQLPVCQGMGGCSNRRAT